MENKLLCGDNLDILPQIEDNSIDVIISDIPYGLYFQNKEWDVLPFVETWNQCLRVLKHGAFMFLHCSIRQDLSSKVIHDVYSAKLSDGTQFKISNYPIVWVMPKGISKGLDMAKLVDKELGKKPIKVKRNTCSREKSTKMNTNYRDGKRGKTAWITKPNSFEAKSIDGLVTGFQPIVTTEFVLVFMKPPRETLVKEAIETGHGGTFLKHGQIYDRDHTAGDGSHYRNMSNLFVYDTQIDTEFYPDISRMFDFNSWIDEKCQFLMTPKLDQNEKWFYCHKCEQAYPKKDIENHNDHQIFCTDCREFGKSQDHRKHDYKEIIEFHPTQKPLEIENLLVQISTKPSDRFPEWVVLDPFCGVGTIPLSALFNGCSYIGIEKNPIYCKIAESRINYFHEYHYNRKKFQSVQEKITDF